LYKFEEAKKIDHRKLGKDLDLFSINDVIGPGLILWHHNGVILRDVISNFFKKIHLENNYEILFTPHIASEELFKIKDLLYNKKYTLHGAKKYLIVDNRTKIIYLITVFVLKYNHFLFFKSFFFSIFFRSFCVKLLTVSKS
jgi:seryl-tRNA synthetase